MVDNIYKRAFLTIFALTLFACNSSAKNTDLYLSACYENASVFKEKQTKVKRAIESLPVLNDYIVLKHGAVSELFYSFTFIGITNNGGIVVYMDDTMLDPIINPLEYELTNELIELGRKNINVNQASKFFTKGVNGVSCYFFGGKIKGKRVNLNVAGRTTSKAMSTYISKIEKLTFQFEKDQQDNMPKLSSKVPGTVLSYKNVFVELQTLH